MNLRKRTWLVIACGVVLTGGAVWTLHAWQVRNEVRAALPAMPDTSAVSAPLTAQLHAAEIEARDWLHARRGLGRLARLYHANGYFEEAAACYRGLTELEPRAAIWPHLWANILAGFGRLEEALPLQARAVELAPREVAVLLRFGEMQLKNNAAGSAAGTFDSVLRIQPDNAYALLGRARCDLVEQNWPAARDRLKKAVGRHPDFAGGWSLLATVHEHLGEPAALNEARHHAQRLGRYRDFPDPWVDALIESCYSPYQLSVAAELTGDAAVARRLLERAIALEPQNSSYHRQLAKFLRAARELALARRELEQAVAAAPTDAESWAALVDLLMEQGDVRALSAAIATGLRHCPASAFLHFVNGNRLAGMGDVAGAESEYKSAKRLQPQEARAYIQLGSLYAQQERVPEAIAEMKAGLAVEPGNARIMVLLAFLQVMASDEAEARRLIHACRQQGLGAADLSGVENAFRERFGRTP